MYKTSVPVAINSIRDESLENDLNKYLDLLKKGSVERVFITVLPGVYTRAFDSDIDSYKLKRSIEFFKVNGFETGVWIGAFGHGSNLAHESENIFRSDYQKITNPRGEAYEHGYCPLDENFVRDYTECVKRLALLHPDVLLLDDDFRLNMRSYGIGCFCNKHLDMFYELTGERIPRERIEKLIFSGGKNKYRDAYMKMSGDTLLGFAKKVREAADTVNPDMRIGLCAVPSVWDLEGTSPADIARALAGETKPLVRLFGAPYHHQHNIINELEYERKELYWIKSENPDIEVISEGDVYPRPRYNVPSRPLELFDLVLSCENGFDGILKYMFNYEYKVGYENGYIYEHIRNFPLRSAVGKVFSDKKTVGIHVFEAIHKLENAEFAEYSPENAEAVCRFMSDIISKNGISTCYQGSEYPVFSVGESARYLSSELLKNGAVLDITAAQILKERGIDVGLLKCERTQTVMSEYYTEFDETVNGLGDCLFNRISCSDSAVVHSLLMPDNTAGFYTYENADGIRFAVFATELSNSHGNANYYGNYFRQEQLVRALEWVGRKSLPAVIMKHPNLYVMTAKNSSATAILLVNMSPDFVREPTVTLDREYKECNCVNCNGVLRENRLSLSDIMPYDFAAIELT